MHEDREHGRAVGARFPSAKQREKLGAPEPGPTPPRHQRPDTSPVGRAGARFPSAKAAEKHEPALPKPAYVPVQLTRPIPDDSPPEPEPVGSRTLVRPYVLTKGRTKATRHLAIEALISATSDALGWRSTEITGEFQSVRALCAHPRSVAEVAATLSVPLGVARVLLGDMADLGLVSVHDTVTNGDGRPAIALMERVLQGLRAI
jgi:hypothetical protein